MSSETIERIVARYAKLLGDDPSKVDDSLFRSCVSEMARDVAGTFFLGIHHSLESMNFRALDIEEQRRLVTLGDERARLAAADFAARVRQSLREAGDTRDLTEISRFAEERFIAEVRDLANATGKASGNA